MNRFGLLLFLLVALALAGGTPAEGRRVARRARPDLSHPELEMELPTAAVPMAPAPLPMPAALPAALEGLRPATTVRGPDAAITSCRPVERAVVAACSRAPPLLG